MSCFFRKGYFFDLFMNSVSKASVLSSSISSRRLLLNAKSDHEQGSDILVEAEIGFTYFVTFD
jgi:hypothetical protein